MRKTANPSFFDRALGACLAGALAMAPTHVLAAGPAAEEAASEPAAAEAPTEVSGTVALLRFTGPDPSDTIKNSTQEELQSAGLTVKGVALDAAAAAKKVKCRGGEMNDSCLAALGKWLNKSKKTASDYIVFGGVEEADGGKVAKVTMYDVAKATVVGQYSATVTDGDLILPLMLPRAVAVDLSNHIVPPAGPTDAEQQILAELDEPAKTEEELAEERQKIADAEKAAGQVGVEDMDLKGIEYDLKKDFKDYCRNGPRKKRESKEDPIDPRPSCKQGPFWGYWQPRAWAFLTLTALAGATTIGLGAVALARRGPYNDAVDAVKAFEKEQGGDPSKDPYLRCNGEGVCYDDLASEVSKTGAEMRSMAIAADAALGTTVLFAAVLAIIVAQDRNYAKDKLSDEKRMRAISGIRLAPMVGRGTGGGALGFSF